MTNIYWSEFSVLLVAALFIYQETPGCGPFEERYTMRMARPRARGCV
jgi:hypothetical protein